MQQRLVARRLPMAWAGSICGRAGCRVEPPDISQTDGFLDFTIGPGGPSIKDNERIIYIYLRNDHHTKANTKLPSHRHFFPRHCVKFLFVSPSAYVELEEANH